MRRLMRPAIFVGAIALIVRVDPVLSVAAVLAGWAWASWTLPTRAAAGITGWRDLPERVLFGEEVTVGINLESESSVTWLALTDTIPFDLGPSNRWVTSLRRGERTSQNVTFAANRRGLHRIGPAVVVTGDAFGLRRVQRTLIPSATILVYPRIVSLEALTVAAGAPLPIIPTRTPLYEDPTRMVGVRQYAPGDPMRRIHWTASAATGSLQVKKFRPGIAREVIVAVDLARDSHPTPGRRRSAELAVTAAASIVDHLITEEREPVGLRILARDVPTGADTMTAVSPGRDHSRMGRMLEALARSDVTSVDDHDSLLDPAGLGFGTSLVLVTGRPARHHTLAALRLTRLGVAVTVIVTVSELHRIGWDTELAEFGIPVRSVARLAEMVEL